MPGLAAWSAILDALPAHWRVDDPKFDPRRNRWNVTAMAEDDGDVRPPDTVSGAGKSALAALVDLASRLPAVPHPAGSSTDELEHVRQQVLGIGRGDSPAGQP
ncbi:MAG: hypothetical protein HY264_00550 [Chloroflexi bacterium]|nr:hypothetical protein [Chloroflexota bacterium]